MMTKWESTVDGESTAVEVFTWDLATLQWAVTAGCPWGAWPDQYCKALPQDALDWAHANGLPCSHVGAERSAGAVHGGCAVIRTDAAGVATATAEAVEGDSDDDLK
jgi:hypothetical protein